MIFSPSTDNRQQKTVFSSASLMNYELRELHEFKSGQTYINLVDYFPTTANRQLYFFSPYLGFFNELRIARITRI